MRLTELAQQVVAAQISGKNGIAIDATAGGGYDSLFLAKTLGAGSANKVFSFDIQAAALTKSQARLDDFRRQNPQIALATVEFCQCNHANLAEFLAAQKINSVLAAMFNLGYFPGGDKQIFTQPQTSWQALQAIWQLLASDGIIALMIYAGHDDSTERDFLLAKIPKLAAVKILQSAIFPSNPLAPQLFLLSKKGSF